VERLMVSDEDLQAKDEWREEMIGRWRGSLSVPTQVAFKPPYGGATKKPYLTYPVGARFNVGPDVFKVISYRIRGRKPTMVVRFDGTLDP
jgi:hypothetical protein